MLDWFTETGFGYLLGVAAVTLVGLVLLYRGLWGDRSKGRVRCPRCWYDMRGTVPKLACPECGHDVRQERRLYKRHRRWGRIAIGLVLLLWAYPLVIVGGWWREQSVMRKYGIECYDIALGEVVYRLGPESNGRVGPVWLVERLPDELGRFFERIDGLEVVDPAQFAACRSLRHLRFLFITGTQVTDADLVHLKGLSKLKSISLGFSPVSAAGVAELQQALPKLTVTTRRSRRLVHPADW